MQEKLNEAVMVLNKSLQVRVMSKSPIHTLADEM